MRWMKLEPIIKSEVSQKEKYQYGILTHIYVKKEIIKCSCQKGASLVAQDSKEICLRCGRPWFDPWVRKIPWRREWLPTPGESHGQRWATLLGVAKSWTQLHTHSCFTMFY